MDVGLDERQEWRHGWLRKDHHVVDATEGRDDRRAIDGCHDRTPRPFRRRHAIVVDRDDQPIGFGRRRLQVVMADVQQVEAAVGEGNGRPARRSARTESTSCSRVTINGSVHVSRSWGPTPPVLAHARAGG